MTRTVKFGDDTIRIENNDGILEYYFNGKWVFAVKEEDPITVEGLKNLYLNGYFD